MDKLNHCRTCIQTLLEQYSHYKFYQEDIESQLCFDPIRDHYQLMRVGWKEGNKRWYKNPFTKVRSLLFYRKQP